MPFEAGCARLTGPDMRGENPASGLESLEKTAADGDLFKPVEPDGSI